MPFKVATTIARTGPVNDETFIIELADGTELICAMMFTQYPGAFFCLAPGYAWPDHVEQAADDMYVALTDENPGYELNAAAIVAWLSARPTIGDEEVRISLRYGSWNDERIVTISGQIVGFRV